MRRERIRVRASGFVAVMLEARKSGPGLTWPKRSTAPNYDFIAWFAERCSEHELARQMEALGGMRETG